MALNFLGLTLLAPQSRHGGKNTWIHNTIIVGVRNGLMLWYVMHRCVSLNSLCIELIYGGKGNIHSRTR